MESKYIALIGGEGNLPRFFIKEVHAQGMKVFLLFIKGVTSPDLIELADDHIAIHITQVGKAIKSCLSRNIEELVMLGRVKHDSIYKISLMKMDWTTAKLWMGMKDRRADTILAAIADAFQNRGIKVMDSTKYLQNHLAQEGVLTKKKPDAKILCDIALGIKVAAKLGEVDVGQTVVVKNGAVVAVEAMEGTDNCLERAAKIAGEGVVIVKTSKPHQDMRFDVPTIGRNTIEKLIKIKASTLAIESKKTLLADDDIISLADQHGIIITSF